MGASLERELGKGEQLGVEEGFKIRLRTMSRGQKPGCRVSLCGGPTGTSPFWASAFSAPRLDVSRLFSPGGS